MSLQLPRKRTLLKWHRWLGIISACFLLIVSFTGLALNHTERLGLDTIHVRNGFILNRYGMQSASDVDSYRIHQTDTLSHLQGTLYYNGTPLTDASKPLALVEGNPITAIATENKLITLTTDGQLIESITIEGLNALGKAPNGKTVLVTTKELLSTDDNWLDFAPYQGAYTVHALAPVELSQPETDQILNHFQGNGIPLYRVLLDLHSGRLFGWGGRTLMDLTALAVILLVSSGLAAWLRKSRQQPPVRHL